MSSTSFDSEYLTQPETPARFAILLTIVMPGEGTDHTGNLSTK